MHPLRQKRRQMGRVRLHRARIPPWRDGLLSLTTSPPRGGKDVSKAITRTELAERTASAAETAVADLEVASVQTATIRQFVCDPVADEQLLEVRNQGTTSGDRVVAVTVDERHARTVMEILTMQDPAIITEAPLNAA